MLHFWVVKNGAYGWLAAENAGQWAYAEEVPFAIVAPQGYPQLESDDDAVLICGADEPTYLAHIGNLERVFSALVPVAGTTLMIDPCFLSWPAAGPRDNRVWLIADDIPPQPVGSPIVHLPDARGPELFAEMAHGSILATDDMGFALWAVTQALPCLMLSGEPWAKAIEGLTVPDTAAPMRLLWRRLPGMLRDAMSIRMRLRKRRPELRDATVAALRCIARGEGLDDLPEWVTSD